jgi:hypothetical protein
MASPQSKQPPACVSCTKPLKGMQGKHCLKCVLRDYVLGGDESLYESFYGTDEDAIREVLSQDPEFAFRFLHEPQSAKRLQDHQHKIERFAPDLAKAIDVVVARRGARLGEHSQLASRLLAASTMRWASAPGAWLILPDLGPEERRKAVAGIADGHFDLPSAVTPQQLLRLVLDKRCSEPRHGSQWISSLTSSAVRVGAARAFGAEGSPAIAEFNLCLVHAWSCMPEQDDLARGDLAELAGADPETIDQMVRQIAQQGDLNSLLTFGGKVADPGRLAQIPAWVRSTQWLGVAIDVELMQWSRRLREEAPSVTDPWVQWAYSEACAGRSSAQMTKVLAGLGDDRTKRSAVTSAASRAGLLVGEGPVAVLDSEVAATGAKTDESFAFQLLFRAQATGQALADVPERIMAWFETAKLRYFAGAATLASLESVNAALEDAVRLPNPPVVLADLLVRLREQRLVRERRDAEIRGHLWIYDLVKHAERHRDDPERWDDGRQILIDEDRAIIERLIERSAVPAAAPWYQIALGEQPEFRMREAAWRLGFAREKDLVEQIRLNAKRIDALLPRGYLSPEQRAELASLCERCGRAMLGRLLNSSPRARTMEAFRRADWRGMLEGEQAPNVVIPFENVRQQMFSPIATVAWSVAAVASIAFVVAAVPPAHPAVNVPSADPLAIASVVTTPTVLDLRDGAGGWKALPGIGWSHVLDESELRRVLPGAAIAADGSVSAAVAAEACVRLQANHGGYTGGLSLPGESSPIPASKCLLRLPRSAEEAGGMGGAAAWNEASRSSEGPSARHRVMLILEKTNGATSG